MYKPTAQSLNRILHDAGAHSDKFDFTAYAYVFMGGSLEKWELWEKMLLNGWLGILLYI